mmetsp:Transcript_9307/g.13914  ORF Transcript_9307/g.13914 Transcript_9307/m.13914 type:complete len:150 (+) Transcript_9307:66-515(+)|eukprot:CAMPEP_0194101840 /NCGR_PEP_ID=MMETSP0150-20130528/2493_1 /TAXON_ID=122233 /ORGANISM="Chaetoceros debilis, Strain MM31A-1" /LENGTH=149 /DNA_ID=CAMNT_0038788575 /DNA_START=19 /DNA_END=468 /DNA_ORIENTATION=-
MNFRPATRSIHRRIFQKSVFRSFSSEEGKRRDRVKNILVAAIDAEPTPRPDFTKEDAAKHFEIGKNYVKGKFQVHNEIHHDLACKIRMKNHAINMFPRTTDELSYLRETALYIDDDDDTMPPLYRSIPLDTPPIDNFDATRYMSEKEDD